MNVALQSNLNALERFFQENQVCRLPQDPALVVKGIERNTCSYFKSNASPLKISFVNADSQGKDINVIFKVGDDLRQDMLVLQIIGIMDQIWLREGLDLRMITYRCLSTGKHQGLVQMVPNSTTLAKIHKRSGILGPLKEDTIKKYFQHLQSHPDNYQKVLDNFLYSCAGWCVVTFILGVCDRHNDNIMVTDNGQMFHIDFGKFLGHSQKFGSIKRDRVPFIFTTEMEYFITEGGERPQRLREFVELCCRAYNIIRRQSPLLIALLELMLNAGLPELRTVEDLKYMHNNLRPQDSDPEATSYFTRKIEESLQCLPVKLNNLIHILANMSLSETAKTVSQINLVDPSRNTKNLLKSVAKTSVRKGGTFLTSLGKDLSFTAGREKSPAVQLNVTFTNQTLSILVKHLNNVYFPDGSKPLADVEMSLIPDLYEPSLRRLKAKSKSASPIFNEIVKYRVPQLEGRVLRLVVRSEGRFLAALTVPLDHVRLNEDVWYLLGKSTA
ncbi:phosphatidylinositol 3-kinase C2 domain-containing subunit gamma [Rhinophrynus dorsalis]